MKLRHLAAIAAVVVACATSPLSAQNLLLDGSFDAIPTNPALVTSYLYAPGHSMGAWTVRNQTVHLVCQQFWVSYDGNCSVDLDGGVGHRGWIEQDVATTIGGTYDLSWRYAANDYIRRGEPRTFQVWWGAASGALAMVGSFSYSAAPGSSLTHLDWDLGQIDGMLATSTLSRLQFRSTTPTGYAGWGAVVDAISLTDAGAATVPEPSTIVLVGIGLAAVAAARRRRAPRR